MNIYAVCSSVVLLTSWLGLRTLAQPAPPVAERGKTETNLLYRSGDDLTEYMRERCRLDVYYPTDTNGFATIVWFHGGGLTSGTRSIPKALQGQGIAVVAAGYRLGPQVQSPAYLEDAAAAVAWTFRHIERYGGSTNRIFVSGHSAGGYLTSMVGLDRRWLAAHGLEANRIAGLIPFSGHAITHMQVRRERGLPNTQPVVDPLAPLYHVRSNAPPLLLITGDRDLEMLGRYEENAYLWRMMKVAGHTNTVLHELQGFDHGGMAEPAFPLLLRFVRHHSRASVISGGPRTAAPIVQADRKPPGVVTNAQRLFRIEQRYLHLPIKNGAPKRVVTTRVEGRIEVKNDLELAPAEPDWWAPMDVSAWRGKTVTLEVDRWPEGSTGLSAIEPGDTIKGAENLYRERLRGQFHFSPRRGWNNDPNGLVFFRGEYHLFFQHNPYGWGWGNMHWGHAVSRDLVHWTELGDALAPDALGPMFSGSAVVDWANTSGLGQPGQPAQVLIFTAAGQPAVQCLASSTDGRTYTKFGGNPVVKQFTPGNRDPKVLWHTPTRQWIMTLYVETNHVHTIFFLGSPNLKDWSLLSQTEGFFECPDFFELPLDGDTENQKWVLTAASSEYRVGRFDGTKFTPETVKLPGHRGRGFYAAQTFSDLPASDGRRLQIGWFQTETKGMPFNQSMTIPLELKLVSTADGPRLTWTPVKELESLRGATHRRSPVTLQPDSANPLAGVQAELVELRAEFEPGEAAEVVFTVRGATIVYHTQREELTVNQQRAPAPLRDGRQRLIIYGDRMGLEVFASDGLTYLPMPFQPKADDLTLGVQARAGSAKMLALEVHALKSAWPTP